MNYPNSKYKIPVSITSDSQNEDVDLWYFPLYSFFDKIKFYFQGKKLISSWEKIFDIKIYDPDGWDRTDPYLFDRYYNKNEFEQGINGSTCEFGDESINYLYKDYWEGCLDGVKECWDIIVKDMRQEEINNLQFQLELITFKTFCKEHEDEIKRWDDLTDEEKKEWLED